MPSQYLRIVAQTGDETAEAALQVDITDVNDVPTIVNALPDRTAQSGSAVSFTIAADAFADDDGDSITYSADRPDGSALPSWLTFDASTRTFTVAANAEMSITSVRVMADDGTGFNSDTFDLIVGSNIAPQATLTTTLTSFHSNNGGVSGALASVTDGNTSSSGSSDYAIHPFNADGQTMTFDLDETYMGGSFLFYNRVNAATDRIDSTVAFRLNGSTVHTATAIFQCGEQCHHRGPVV